MMHRYIMLFGIVAIFAYSYVPVYDGIQVLGVYPYQFYRYLLCLGVIVILYFKTLQFKWNIIRSLGTVSFLASICSALGIAYTTPVTAAFVTGGTVMFVPIIDYLYNKQKIKASSIVMILCMLVGLFIFTEGWNMKMSGGVWILLVSDVLWAMQFVYINRHSQKASNETVTFSIILAQVIGCGMMCLVTSSWAPPSQVAPLWLNFIVTGVVVSIFCSMGQVYVQKKVSILAVSLVFTLEPVFTAIIQLVLGNEHLMITQAVGGLLMVGVAISYSLFNQVKKKNIDRKEKTA